MVKNKRKYWNNWRIGYLVVWLILFIYCMNWINNNPYETSFSYDRVVNSTTGQMYQVNSCGKELPLDYQLSFNKVECRTTLYRPPLAYSIYSWQNKYGSIVTWISGIWFIVWLIMNYQWLGGLVETWQKKD